MGIVETAVAIGAVASVAAAGVGAYSSIQAGNAAKAQGDYQAQVAAFNAQQAKQNQDVANQAAARTEQAGNSALRDQARRTQAAIGSQAASEASTGLDINSGSALDLRSDTSALGLESMGNIRANTAQSASNQRVQGINYANEALTDTASGQMASLAGENAASASETAAFGSILSGLGSAGKSYSDLYRTGVVGKTPISVGAG